MKKLAILILAAGASVAAHAELLLPKGAKATLKVEYIYTSSGDYRAPSKSTKMKWNVRRAVNMTALYAADAPQPFGAMHTKDEGQAAKIGDLKVKSEATQAKMQPMMADMMKIVQDCQEDEKCIEKRVFEYGSKMKVPKEMNQTRDTITEMGRPGAPRFQLWRLVSQGGSYLIDERHETQIYEMTCTETKVCKRTMVTKGGGELPAPPGGRSIAGASMFEVDGGRKDVVVSLPVPLAPLVTDVKVETTIPNDPITGGKSFAKPFFPNPKPITVAIKGNRILASGTQTVKREGEGPEGGTLTTTWTLTAQE